MSETLTLTKDIEYFLSNYTSFPYQILIDEDIKIDYYNGLDIENTLLIGDSGYKNLELVSFIQREIIYNIMEYIRLNPESFFISQVEHIVIKLNKNPILVFRNNNSVCDRAVFIDVDKIIEEDINEFKFLRKININYSKWITGIFGIGLISTFIYLRNRR